MKSMKQLSMQERKVFNRLKKGLKNREIAEDLDISQKAISEYIRRIRDKAGVDADKNLYYLVQKVEDKLNFANDFE